MKTTLTDRAVKSAKSDISDAIVPGLLLRVRPSGAKSFALVARFPGSPNPTRRTIAPVGATSLADARDKAREWLALLARGIDPAEQVERDRRDADRKRKDTVAALAEMYLARRVIGKIRQERKYVQNFRDVLIPLFGHRPVADLTSREVSLALAEIETHGTDHGLVKLGARKELRRPTRAGKPAAAMARSLFVYLDGMLRWAAGTGDYGIEFSPLQRVSKKHRFGTQRKRERVLTAFEIAAAWRASGTLRTPFRQFYRLLMLTGVRLTELRKAKWIEFDLDAKLWSIPASRMKGKVGIVQKHEVPLTQLMLGVIDELPDGGGRGPYLFSVNGGRSPISENGKTKIMLDEAICADLKLPDSVLLRENYDPEATDRPMQHFTNHDLRRTLRTMITDLGVDFHTGEAMLAHVIPGSAGVYDRNRRLILRRKAHETWGKFLVDMATRERGNVVALRKGAAR